MATNPDLSLTTEVPRYQAAAYVRSIFDREMGVTLHNAQVGSPRDDAMRELTKATTNLYARRVLRELIQNAFDGAASTGNARILVRLDLRESEYGTLYVANSGVGFTEDNVDAISNPALSNKRPGNFIGHKGLGFRSVELLSDETQIYSVAGSDRRGGAFDGFCFRFAGRDDERAWLDATGATAFAEAVIGRTHRLQLPLPIELDPPEVARFAESGFATLVRLPLRDALAADRAQEEMRLLIDEKAPLALFLHELSSLTLETIGRDGNAEIKPLSRTIRDRTVSARARGLTIEQVTIDRRRFLVGSMPVDEPGFRASIERSVEQRHPVEKWREWVGTPSVSAAFPLSADARRGSYYAFLPMDTEAPFNGCLDAPFFPDHDRRGLDLSIPLNSFLLDSVADLCLAVAEEIADANETSSELACVAADALAWCRDPDRLKEACDRAGVGVGTLRLPTIRRRIEETRWARLDEIYDWDDSARRAVTAAWLVRACDVPTLRRGMGDARRAALHEMVYATDFTLQPSTEHWAEWLPVLAADLSARKRTPRETWENFYADLADMDAVLPHLRGAEIFRVADGVLAAANSPEMSGQRELFISPDPDAPGRRRRLSGTTLFPPPSVAKRMEFADPGLRWSPAVAKAMFDAGLATEYSLAKVVSGMGRLLGIRPSRTVLLAALRWTFSAWLAHKSPELEKALKTSGLQVPVAGGAFKPATVVRFGVGWRDTRGDLVAELGDSAADASKGTRALRDALLPSWDAWPLRERGTAGEWLAFLKLIGVRDGLAVVFYKEQV
ncbi:ATP-binding protein, partial [Mesorhizobium sp. M7A.F.Ca.US.001.01.1.1]